MPNLDPLENNQTPLAEALDDLIGRCYIDRATDFDGSILGLTEIPDWLREMILKEIESRLPKKLERQNINYSDPVQVTLIMQGYNDCVDDTRRALGE